MLISPIPWGGEREGVRLMYRYRGLLYGDMSICCIDLDDVSWHELLINERKCILASAYVNKLTYHFSVLSLKGLADKDEDLRLDAAKL